MISKLKILGAISSAALLIGGIGGWSAKAKWDAGKLVKALEAERAAHAIDMENLQSEMNASVEETIRLSAELDAAQSSVRTVTHEIIREVPKYVQDSTPDCDRTISIDAMRLLDAAARGAAPSPKTAQASTRDISDALSGKPAVPGYYPTSGTE